VRLLVNVIAHMQLYCCLLQLAMERSRTQPPYSRPQDLFVGPGC